MLVLRRELAILSLFVAIAAALLLLWQVWTSGVAAALAKGLHALLTTSTADFTFLAPYFGPRWNFLWPLVWAMVALIGAAVAYVASRRAGRPSAAGLAAGIIALATLPSAIFAFWFYGKYATFYIIGRPLRGAKAPSARDWWSRAAQDELDAAAAFGRLANELLAHGAPTSLVDRCEGAADQERQHARLAEACGGAPPRARTAPRPLPPLAVLAIESLEDGVLGETVNVAHAKAEARRAPATEQAAFRQIATEEAAHADLGEAVVRWCVAAGGAEVRHALARHRLRLGRVNRLRAGPGWGAWRAWLRARRLQALLSRSPRSDDRAAA